MFIDIVCLLLVLIAVIKGYSKGLIVGIFSFAAFIIGLAAALKLSALLANYLHDHAGLNGRWLPVLSFILLFIGVAIAVKWLASLLKGVAQITFLGWADALGGILLYVFLYMMIYSVFLFFGSRLHLISAETQASSQSYHYIEPWAPWVIDGVAKLAPVFKNMFSDLQLFFEGATTKSI